MKEFLMLIRENADYSNLTLEEMQADIEKHMSWVEDLVAKGHFKDGNPLEGNGIVLKSKMKTDGPYIETKECISGYYFLLANSLEEAGKLAESCPALETGAILEIREVMITSENE